MSTDTVVETRKEGAINVVLPRHIVEKDDSGTPMDKALCGYLWDRMNVKPNGEVCKKCVEIFRRQEGA